ncbi:hypothetical protein ONR57_06895 [Hoyosella sp. YIM 151337]|uniref:hypothetical protein n=1 Tax=Hoyosella sp. YIM 151337 TaxID=2992742 RepID=UPI00223616BD|nr:hypothetical protein [Hoyosella sp. YIM 151337]MCW4353020.1 hypothetical protein [Hoyosella sp. YIM 151337]
MSAASRNAAINAAVWMILVSGVAVAFLIAVADLLLFSMIIGMALGTSVGILAAVYFTGPEEDPFSDGDGYGLAN